MQGKFSLQLEIKNILQNKGYSVGYICTEPSGYLFDADFVFPIGYNSTVELNSYDVITLLNEQMWEIEISKKDLVIAGCQSGTIHYNNINLNQFAIKQYEFILGTLPDVYILCINVHDELDYIKKTINYLNSIDEGKVKFIVVYPIVKTSTETGIGFKERVLSEPELKEFIKDISNEINLSFYILGNVNSIDGLCEDVLNLFSGGVE